MEFLIGRSLTNNITNLLLDRYVEAAAREASLDWLGLIEQEPDAGPGQRRPRTARRLLSSIRWRRCSCRRQGYGLRYEYGMFRQAIENGWQREYPDNWLQPSGSVGGGASQRSRRGQARLLVRHAPGQNGTGCRPPLDVDRHPVRPTRCRLRRQTINTLRLWRAAAHDYFDFKEFSGGDFVGALFGKIAASTLTRVL